MSTSDTSRVLRPSEVTSVESLDELTEAMKALTANMGKPSGLAQETARRLNLTVDTTCTKIRKVAGHLNDYAVWLETERNKINDALNIVLSKGRALDNCSDALSAALRSIKTGAWQGGEGEAE